MSVTVHGTANILKAFPLTWYLYTCKYLTQQNSFRIHNECLYSYFRWKQLMSSFPFRISKVFHNIVICRIANCFSNVSHFCKAMNRCSASYGKYFTDHEIIDLWDCSVLIIWKGNITWKSLKNNLWKFFFTINNLTPSKDFFFVI